MGKLTSSLNVAAVDTSKTLVTPTRLQAVISQKSAIEIFASMKISNLNILMPLACCVGFANLLRVGRGVNQLRIGNLPITATLSASQRI
jgi:hypothetical protein